jgi:hypothetical protein
LRKAFFPLAIAIAIAAVAAPALAEGPQDFELHNQTGLTIKTLYVEPSANSDNWGEDLLKGNTLEGDSDTKITFAPDSTECQYDIKIVDDKDNTFEVKGVDLCKVSHFSLTKEGDVVKYAAE